MNNLEKAIEYFKNMIENTEARKEKDLVKKAICAQVISSSKMAEIALMEKLEREQGCEYCLALHCENCKNNMVCTTSARHGVCKARLYKFEPHNYCCFCGRKLEEDK